MPRRRHPSRVKPRPAHAVVVGIGEYLRGGKIPPLRFAEKDAEAMAAVLKDPGLCGFPEERVRLLTGPDATRDEIVRSLGTWLPDRARGAEIVLFYFAGHGVLRRLGERDEEGYLFPYDADPDDILARGLAMSDVARCLKGIEADALLLCFDCCHAGKVIPRAGLGGGALPRGIGVRPSAFHDLLGKGRYLIASCDEGQVSLESSDLGHGLFTYHLVEGLRGR
ncbi:MAG TPA: caspase family protein, partial [Planctomycetota bacterium]|nr:caspase family protein [Planctomycetota bacterium]